MSFERSDYRNSLPALEQHYSALRRRCRLLVWLPLGLSVLACFASAMQALRGPGPRGMVLYLDLVLLLYPLLLLYSVVMHVRAVFLPYREYSDKLVERLASSDLARRIDAGLLEQDQIWAYVPAWVRRRWQTRPDSALERMRRCAVFANWYAEPPRQLYTKAQSLGIRVAMWSPWLLALGLLLFGAAWVYGRYLWTYLSLLLLLYLCHSLLRLLITPHFVCIHLSALRGHLEQHWSHSADAANGSAGEAEMLPLSRMQMLVNQFESDLLRASQRLTARSIASMVVVILFVCMPLSLGLFSPLVSLLLSVGLIGASIFAYLDGQDEYRQRISAQLAQSELWLRIASGSLSYESIENWLLPGTKRLLHDGMRPPGYGDQLRRILWRIGLNLDWYLGPPRRLLRLAWLTPLLLLGLVAGLLVYSQLPSPGSLTQSIQNSILIGLLAAALLIAFWLPEIRLARNRMIWAHCWVDYLRGTLGRSDEDGDGPDIPGSGTTAAEQGMAGSDS